MRGIVGLVLSVLAIAGAVLYASEAQRSTAETTFREAQGADQLRVLMLEQNRSAARYVLTGNQSSLNAYVASGHDLEGQFVASRKVSADDAQETALLQRQVALHASWESRPMS